MGDRGFRYLLSGVVEVDDAYIGSESENNPGSRKHSGCGTTKNKVVVSLSLTEKNKPGYLKVQVVEHMTAEELTGFVRQTRFPSNYELFQLLRNDRHARLRALQGL